MCTKLPNNALEERLRWVLPIINKQVKLKDVASVFPGGKRTTHPFLGSIKWQGNQDLCPDTLYLESKRIKEGQ
jgi:hypothetical protein